MNKIRTFVLRFQVKAYGETGYQKPLRRGIYLTTICQKSWLNDTIYRLIHQGRHRPLMG